VFPSFGFAFLEKVLSTFYAPNNSLTRVASTFYPFLHIPAENEPMTTLTVSDIAQRVQRPGEELRTAVDRVRNWTKEGLLKPIGDIHPGTGRKKQYSEKAAVRAMILQAISDATGGRAVYLAHMLEFVETELRRHRGQRDTIFAMSRKAGGGGKFHLSTWNAKKFGQGILESQADIHIVLNPNRILDQMDKAGD
jgi:hypothetical protein